MGLCKIIELIVVFVKLAKYSDIYVDNTQVIRKKELLVSKRIALLLLCA